MKKANAAWVGLATYVVAYDWWAIATGHETLSSAATRAINHPIKRWPTVMIMTLAYTHLILPQPLHKYDPLRIVATRLTS